MRPYLSIIIPVYNRWEKLATLLLSLAKSPFRGFEIIVGDDASHQEKPERLLQLLSQKIGNRRPVLVRIPLNRGPAAARNAAAKRASGRVLVFLDSDVTVYPDTLAKIREKFAADPDLTALTGVWDKHQYTRAFFPQFKALRDWSYWTNEAEREGYYYLFSTRIAAIKRSVFVRLGGFNEAFRQMEDVEITYRIARRYAIIFASDVRVHHEFEGFWPVAKKYFWRSFFWSRLYSSRRKFDPVATTAQETLTALTGVSAAGLLIIGAFSRQLSVAIFSLAAAFFLLHLGLLRKFLSFVYREKGLFFTLQSVATGLALYCVIVAGALYQRIADN